MIYLDLLYITIAIVCIVDISGFVDSVKTFLSFIITKGKIAKSDYSLKPFDCSLCLTFWACLIYILATGQFSFLLLAYILLLAVFTVPIKELIILLKDIILKLTSTIYEKFID